MRTARGLTDIAFLCTFPCSLEFVALRNEAGGGGSGQSQPARDALFRAPHSEV